MNVGDKPTCLTIAGFDPSAGAGVLADLEAFRRGGVRARAVITAVTAQNSHRVLAVHPLPAARVGEQITALCEELRPDAIKIGMLGTAAVVRQVARFLAGQDAPVVLDPVMRASAGAELLTPAGVRALIERLLPLVTVITPNREEAQRLLEMKIGGKAGFVRAARKLIGMGSRAAVVTGGDRRGQPVDVLCGGGEPVFLEGERVRARCARGTGCRFSAALAAQLARGQGIEKAARAAKTFVENYLRSGC